MKGRALNVKVKRLLIEASVAAMIFIAAKAVYGFEMTAATTPPHFDKQSRQLSLAQARSFADTVAENGNLEK